MFLFALLCSLCNVFVKGSKTFLQGSNLLSNLSRAVSKFCELRRQRIQLIVSGCLLTLCFCKLCNAKILLSRIVLVVLCEDRNHLVNHLEDLREINSSLTALSKVHLGTKSEKHQ